MPPRELVSATLRGAPDMPQTTRSASQRAGSGRIRKPETRHTVVTDDAPAPHHKGQNGQPKCLPKDKTTDESKLVRCQRRIHLPM
jgi:hypothetical protein